MDTQALQAELQAQQQEEKEEEGPWMEELEKHGTPLQALLAQSMAFPMLTDAFAAALDTNVTMTPMLTNSFAATWLAAAAVPPVLAYLLAATILAVIAPSVV